MKPIASLDQKFSSGDQLVADSAATMELAQEKLQSIKEKNCVDSGSTGWYDYPQISGLRLAEEIRTYVDEGIDFAYDLVVVIGIGGSYLGTRAVYEATKIPTEKPYKAINLSWLSWEIICLSL